MKQKPFEILLGSDTYKKLEDYLTSINKNYKFIPTLREDELIYNGFTKQEANKISSIGDAYKIISTTYDNNIKLISAKLIGEYVRVDIGFGEVEKFVVIYCNKALIPSKKEILHTGGVSCTVVDDLLIIKNAILQNCRHVFIAHNHPSNNCFPSGEDKKITKKIKDRLSFFDIELVDHVIVTRDNEYSFHDNGML